MLPGEMHAAEAIDIGDEKIRVFEIAEDGEIRRDAERELEPARGAAQRGAYIIVTDDGEAEQEQVRRQRDVVKPKDRRARDVEDGGGDAEHPDAGARQMKMRRRVEQQQRDGQKYEAEFAGIEEHGDGGLA